MKIKKVVALCLTTKRVCLFNHVDEDGVITQWLGDGSAFYPLNGVPFLEEETFCTVFDVPEEKLMIRCGDMPEGVSVEDFTDEDQMVQPMGMSIYYGGSEVSTLRAKSGGITFIKRKYLAPLDDMTEVLQFYERVDSSGRRYIVVLSGLLIAAIIYPFDIVCDDLLEKLEALLRRTKEELKKKNAMAAGEEPLSPIDGGQETLFDKESGEEG